jgi:drug/metabolite transporter (DMT)-like permease
VRRRDTSLLVVLGLVWGAVYPLTTIALHGFAPTSLVAARTTLAAVFLLPVIAATGYRGLRAHPVAVTVAALMQATAPLILLTSAQQHLSAGLAGTLSATQPIFVALLSGLLGEPINRRHWTGLLAAFTGVALLFLGDLHASATNTLAAAAVLGSALLFASGTVYIGRVLPEVPAPATAGAAMGITTLVMLPIALTAGEPPHPTPGPVAAVVALGFLNAGPLALFYWLIHHSGATHAALAWYIAPAAALLYDLPIHGTPTALEITGLTLILAGIAAATTERSPRERRIAAIDG